MSRVLLLLLAAVVLAGCGATHPRLTVRAAHPKGSAASTVPCASVDCGPYAATFGWAGVTVSGATGYYVTLNGSQVADVASSPFVFHGMDCGASFTLGVQAHDGSGNTGTAYSQSYSTPACPGAAVPAIQAEPVVTGTVATGSALSTTNGTWSNTPTSFGYQWQDCATDGTGCSNIGAATSSSYTVASGDAGHTIKAVVTATNANGSSSPAGAPIVPAVDEFSGAAVDSNVWSVMNQQGDTSNSEIECYLPSQTTQSGGTLTETLVDNVSTFTCPAGTPSSTNPLHYKAGAMQMKSVAFTFGTIVVKAKLGSNAGGWPAIWLLGASCQSPNWLTNPGFSCSWPSDASDAAEIDIAENPGGQGTTSVGEFMHTGANSSCTASGLSDTSANFHTYELDWTSGSVVWKVDGTQTCSVSSGVPSHPMFLITDEAQGASVPSPTSNVFDYIHVSH